MANILNMATKAATLQELARQLRNTVRVRNLPKTDMWKLAELIEEAANQMDRAAEMLQEETEQ